MARVPVKTMYPDHIDWASYGGNAVTAAGSDVVAVKAKGATIIAIRVGGRLAATGTRPARRQSLPGSRTGP